MIWIAAGSLLANVILVVVVEQYRDRCRQLSENREWWTKRYHETDAERMRYFEALRSLAAKKTRTPRKRRGAA